MGKDKVTEVYEGLQARYGYNPMPHEVLADLPKAGWNLNRVLRTAPSLWGYNLSPESDQYSTQLEYLSTYYKIWSDKLEVNKTAAPPYAEEVAQVLKVDAATIHQIALGLNMMIHSEEAVLPPPPPVATPSLPSLQGVNSTPVAPPKPPVAYVSLEERLKKAAPLRAEVTRRQGTADLVVTPIYKPDYLEIGFARSPKVHVDGWDSIAGMKTIGYVPLHPDDMARDEDDARIREKVCLRQWEIGPENLVVVGSAVAMAIHKSALLAYQERVNAHVKALLTDPVSDTMAKVDGVPAEVIERGREITQQRKTRQVEQSVLVE